MQVTRHWLPRRYPPALDEFGVLVSQRISCVQSSLLVAAATELGIKSICMHAHEEATIRAFIVKPRRDRWLQKLASSKHRKSFLDRLNHCQDIDERYAMLMPSSADAAAALRTRGALSSCYVTSNLSDIDGQELPLAEAIHQTELGGFGTLICCIPGRLAYYIDEAGAGRRLLLARCDD